MWTLKKLDFRNWPCQFLQSCPCLWVNVGRAPCRFKGTTTEPRGYQQSALIFHFWENIFSTSGTNWQTRNHDSFPGQAGKGILSNIKGTIQNRAISSGETQVLHTYSYCLITVSHHFSPFKALLSYNPHCSSHEFLLKYLFWKLSLLTFTMTNISSC